MRRHFRWDRKYLYWGITAFCVIAAAILFYMALRFLPDLRRAISSILKILSPFIWGFVITYLISPLMKRLEKSVFGPLCRRAFPKKGGEKLARALSVVLSELILVAILVGLVYLILPSLVESIGMIIANRTKYYETVTKFIGDFQIRHPEIYKIVGESLTTITGDINDWAARVLPTITGYLTDVVESAYVVLRGIYNLLIGIIVSIYVLFDLERFTAAFRRWLYSLFSLETAERLREAIAFTDRTFMGFITGKLLDSAIIGLICYIVCAILRIPYALLVSAIVGVTNVIPFFGPFIGAVPSAFIILMMDPVKCLIFIIFIIILQQIDGNIIGPKIMGSAIGITGFWVLFAIVVGAGLFGFPGMLLGVPVFVVIYTFLNYRIESRLKKNDLPWETEKYLRLDHIDPVTREPVKQEPEEPAEPFFEKKKAEKEEKAKAAEKKDADR
ncbi:MAG: AI-2E family transporter [Oscillospiraceae bacterium]|nr:AI-2E family transporter [Oscillospiraceae bacterium]